MKWEQAMERRVTWKDIWQWNPQRIKFLIQVVYDVFTSPSNLHTKGKIETPAYPLCSKTGTLEHILSSCSKALSEGWLDMTRSSNPSLRQSVEDQEQPIHPSYSQGHPLCQGRIKTVEGIEELFCRFALHDPRLGDDS